MPTSEDFVDYYEVLEIRPNATEQQIEQAIHAKQRVWGSRQSTASSEKRAFAELQMAKIEAAESTLLNPDRRRAFDTHREQVVKRRQESTGGGRRNSNGRQRDQGRQQGEQGQGGHGGGQSVATLIQASQQALDKGTLGVALKFAEKAIDTNPASDSAWRQLAKAKRVNNQNVEADAAAREAIKLNKNNANLVELAECRMARNDYQGAFSPLRQAFDLSKKKSELNDIRLLMNICYCNTGHADMAIPVARDLVESEPKNPWYQRELAEVLLFAAKQSITTTVSGDYCVTSKAQADLVLKYTTEALELKFNDATMRTQLSELNTSSKEALKPQKGIKVSGLAVVLFLVGIFLLALNNILLPLAFWAAAGFLQYQRMSKPRYRVEYEIRTKANDVSRWGI